MVRLITPAMVGGRRANRIVVKAIETETEAEYNNMVAAVERLIDKGEEHLSSILLGGNG